MAGMVHVDVQLESEEEATEEDTDLWSDESDSQQHQDSASLLDSQGGDQRNAVEEAVTAAEEQQAALREDERPAGGAARSSLGSKRQRVAAPCDAVACTQVLHSSPQDAERQPGVGRRGSAADGGSWPHDTRPPTVRKFDTAEATNSDETRIAAQVHAITAALQLSGAGLPFPERLACIRQFLRLDGVLRSGLLAELRLIVEEGSTADLPAWVQDVRRS